MSARKPLTLAQKVVLTAAFVPMLATGAAGAAGTFSNVSNAYGTGTALGAVAAGEGATAVLALVLLGLTMLGQSSPLVVRMGLWALPTAASAMSAMAAPDAGRTVIYAITPLGMCVAAEGMAFLARRIVVHQDGRDAEAERKAASVVQALAYHRARAANHPDAELRAESERTSWKLARKVGAGDTSLGLRLVEVQRDRVTDGADAALASMFAVTPAVTPVTAPVTLPLSTRSPRPELDSTAQPTRDAEDTQVKPHTPASTTPAVTGPRPDVETPVTVPSTPAPTEDDTEDDGRAASEAVTLEEVAFVAGVTSPRPGDQLSDEQLVVVLRHLRYSVDPPMSYRQAAAAFREAGYVGAESRVRAAWGVLMEQEAGTP
ncbi:hypothetical protein CG747_10595 [Streptomyces sp. CB02959]|uniref:hypothetical protein n=1 Tax=Streptomyces sp. CB02959 TaxID=2020330 RepID=UPI000C26E3C5|nr:hypothetical protein [Streptomyces sp. CB02959]PJN40927.1 hypothetical protein CG747_10595 [Streptomyces sp. CB02959]